MRKNLIVRKRHLLTILMLLMIMCLGGCAPQLTVDTYTHEAGEELLEDAAAYAVFKNPEKEKEAVVDVSKVEADKVGTYEAVIMLNKKEYPFTVEVVDTTAPKGTFANFVTTVGIDGTVTADSFGIESTDVSEIKQGFRNVELIKTEEEVKTIFSESIESLDKHEEIDVEELLGLSWEQETDTWYEENATWENLDEEFVPDENGLYQLEFVAVDSSGNADILKCYVLADMVAPTFTQLEEIEIYANNDFEAFVEALDNKIEAEDNMLGNMKSRIQIVDWNAINETSNSSEVKYEYLLVDAVGNTTIAERIATVNWSNSVYAAQEVEVTNVYDRGRAEQAFAQVNQQRVAAGLHELVWDESLYEFACTRSSQIVDNFSHYMPDGTYAPSYLLHNIGGANGYGENIAGNFKSITNLVNGWMNSQGHKENILDSRYTAGVMACYCHNGTYYWVNLFKAQ